MSRLKTGSKTIFVLLLVALCATAVSVRALLLVKYMDVQSGYVPAQQAFFTYLPLLLPFVALLFFAESGKKADGEKGFAVIISICGVLLAGCCIFEPQSIRGFANAVRYGGLVAATLLVLAGVLLQQDKKIAVSALFIPISIWALLLLFAYYVFVPISIKNIGGMGELLYSAFLTTSMFSLGSSLMRGRGKLFPVSIGACAAFMASLRASDIIAAVVLRLVPETRLYLQLALAVCIAAALILCEGNTKTRKENNKNA